MMRLKSTKLKWFLYVTLLCNITTISLRAQSENVWIFGAFGGGDPAIGGKLDFNAGNPVFSFIKFTGVAEASASICDTRGQLLFYSEGDTIWNKNGQVMPNGGGLTGLSLNLGGYTATSSSTQGALIVPMPGHPDQYYVFSLTDNIARRSRGISGHLFYSVVDMKLNGGLGDVVPGQKGIFVDSGFTESVTGVAGDHCNIWIVAPAYSSTTYRSDLFKVYELTENGLRKSPAIFNVGNGVSDLPTGECSNVKFSPDRKKLVRSRILSSDTNCLELYDFDPATGVISNRINLDAASGMDYFSTCFSPDNSKLYASTGFLFGSRKLLYQFDLSVYSRTAINSSKTLIDSGIGNIVTDIKCGPDGKLYYFRSAKPALMRIGYPDKVGIACAPEMANIEISDDIALRMFPNDVPLLRVDTSYGVNHYTFCTDDGIIQPSDTSSLWFHWDDGSVGSMRTITESGTYWVQHGNYCHYFIDSFVVKIENFLPAVITTKVFELATTATYATYQWLLNGQVIPSATESTYTVTENGKYTVAVSNGNGCADTSAIYEVTNYTNIADTETIAEGIHVYPNPAQDLVYINAPVTVNVCITSMEGRWLKENQEARSIHIADMADGIYLLRITDVAGRLLRVQKMVKGK